MSSSPEANSSIATTLFRIVAPFAPAGDQPQAIETLAAAILAGEPRVCLRGATGTGKTFTIANLIHRLQRPALVIAPNKTLAAQLTDELRSFLPDSAVEMFVSYYDFYQPEAYLPASDTFIDKEATVNAAIDRMRHRATVAALTRRDTVVVASVSCIYGLGDPAQYLNHLLRVKKGDLLSRDMLLKNLVSIGFSRNDAAPAPGSFRARGDVVDVFDEAGSAVRFQFDLDRLEKISTFDPVLGQHTQASDLVTISPRSHYVADRDTLKKAIESIEEELEVRLAQLERESLSIEAQRLRRRTLDDIESLRELGFCRGVENYSAHFDSRNPGEPPYTLFDYFPDDLLCVVDESHVTVPQLGSMFAGDRSRKATLIGHGFRLPSAADNRPLTFSEFDSSAKNVVFLSATPGPYELSVSPTVAEQLIRPTGIIDPAIQVRSSQGQIEDLVQEAALVVADGGRVLVTALTKKLAELVADAIDERGIKARFLHSDLDTLSRSELLSDLRKGVFDVLVGVNLLREGLDLPEVQLVAVLDADREGFLRSETALIQTIGRAARNVKGRVIFYAETITKAMRSAIKETDRRRSMQQAYNTANGVVPKTTASGRPVGSVTHAIVDLAVDAPAAPDEFWPFALPARRPHARLSADELEDSIVEARDLMSAAAAALDFEQAACARDRLVELEEESLLRR